MMMSVDYKTRKIKRTKHFKKKNTLTVKDLVPFIKFGFKVTFLALMVITGYLAWGQVSSRLKEAPYFQVRKMAFKGCVKVREDELYAQSGITDETNLFALDMKELAANMTKHPWVKKVAVKKQYPDRLIVTVEEREPVAMVNLDRLYYIDEDGEVFKKVVKGDNTYYPVITGVSEYEAFSKRADDKKLIMKAISLIDMLQLRDDFTDKDISEINISEIDGLVLYTYRGALPVKVGHDISNKAFDRLVRVFKELDKMGVHSKFIDIDYDKRVVVRVETSS